MSLVDTLRQHKSSIIISSIIGIILFYSQPLLTLLGSWIVNLAVSLSSTFSNFYYISIARNDPNLINFYSATILIVMFLFLMANSVVELYQEFLSFQNKLRDLKEKLNIIPRKEKLEKTDFEKDIGIIESKLNKTKFSLRSYIVFIFILFISIYFFHGFCSLVNNKNVMFRNKLIILSVYIDEMQVNQLKAKWVQMESEEDYNTIKTELDDYFIKFNIGK